MLADLTKSRAAAVYAALTELERLAALIPVAPALADRMAVADLLPQRHRHYRELLEDLEGEPDPQSAMGEAAPAVDAARRRVEPGDWWEALAAVALCAPLTDELFGALLGDNDDAVAHEDVAPADEAPESAEASADVVAADVTAQWATRRLQAAIEADPVLAARIAMWGRRLVGETIVLSREFGGERHSELADRLAVNHLRRLTELGVSG